MILIGKPLDPAAQIVLVQFDLRDVEYIGVERRGQAQYAF